MTVVDILLDEEEILYPYANEGEVKFMLSTADVSYQQFKSGVKDGGTIVIEPNLVHPTEEDRKRWNIVEIPIITIAKEEVGNVITQSVVALAITQTFMKPVDRDGLFKTMLSKVPAKFVFGGGGTTFSNSLYLSIILKIYYLRTFLYEKIIGNIINFNGYTIF